MTLIIGIKCNDGLVMAADSMNTEAAPQGAMLITRHETGKKLTIQRELLWGSSGSVGIRQLVENLIATNYDQIYRSDWSPILIRHNIVNIISSFVIQQYKIASDASFGRGPIPHTNFLFGVYAQSDFYLLNIECDMAGEVVISRHFATGSGAKTGQALLRRLRNQDWDLRTGEVVAYRTMNDAIHVEPGGIGPPIRLARYFKDAQGLPKIETIDGMELDRIRDTAMAWTEMEQTVLAELNKPPEGEGLPEPLPAVDEAPIAPSGKPVKDVVVPQKLVELDTDVHRH